MPATILRPLLLFALLLWCAVAPAQQPRAGAQPRPIILVLDASGSMWKRYLDRGPRRGEFAAAVVDTLTQSLRSQASGNEPVTTAQLGLVRFGYQFYQRDQKISNEDKCKDVEHIRPARIDDRQIDAVARASGVKQEMDDQGRGWNPKGHTPVTAAILQAAQDAPAQGADLVIVTDIIEGEKICDPIRAPAAASIRFSERRTGTSFGKKYASVSLSLPASRSRTCSGPTSWPNASTRNSVRRNRSPKPARSARKSGRCSCRFSRRSTLTYVSPGRPESP